MSKWEAVVEEARRLSEEYLLKHGLAPTLRGLFYILVSKDVIPNTKTAYQALSAKVAEARYLGKFPWHLIRDESRRIWWGESGSTIADADKIVSELKSLTPEKKEELLKHYLSMKYQIKLNKWEGQKHSVMVVVEKEAQYDAVVRMITDWDVTVTTSRGFESATSAKLVADWVASVRAVRRVPVILGVFDWDPSGEYAGEYDLMFRVCALVLNRYGSLITAWRRLKDLDAKREMLEELLHEADVIYEKAMLTWEQVQKYKLPPVPSDPAVLEKLKRDPRAKLFADKYGFLGQVEVEAMIALRFDEAKAILNATIEKYFDRAAYESVKKREEELREKVKQAL